MTPEELSTLKVAIVKRIDVLEQIVDVLRRMLRCRTFPEFSACEEELKKLQEPYQKP